MAVDYCATCKHDPYRHHTPTQRKRNVVFRDVGDSIGSILIEGACPHGRRYWHNLRLAEDTPLTDIRTIVESYDIGCGPHANSRIEWCDDCDCSGYVMGEAIGFGVTTGPGFPTFLELPPIEVSN